MNTKERNSSSNKQNIQLQTKMLIAVITIGFFLICITSFLAISGLKYDYETNFPGPIKEVQKLKNIQDFFIIDIMNYINHKTDISSNRNQMLLLWNQYKKQHKPKVNFFDYFKKIYRKVFSQENYLKVRQCTELEKQEVQKVDDIIKNTDALFTRLYNKESKNYETDIKILIGQSIQINQLISNVIALHLKIIMLKNSSTNVIYKMTLVLLVIFMFVVIFMVLFLSNLVLKYIKNINEGLQETVNEKTKELKEINKNLQRAIKHEVEQSRKKDQIMYQQARLASMGEMIQNIAHQWRQPLNSMIILIQTFKIKFYNGKLDKKFIEEQTEDGIRIAKNMSATIENFRNFFRPNKNSNDFSIKKTIEDTIKILSPVLEQRNIYVHIDIPEDVIFYGHENSLAQIFANLIKNSHDAISDQKIENGECEISSEIKESYLYFQMKDNAVGIKNEFIDKVFEPYFTTKHKSVGTGIGLYMTKEIIEKQMYGTISVSNSNWVSKFSAKSYYGAIFLIKLPIKQNQQKDKHGQI
ncbi:sensor histidine kinase [Helicobacter cappadocius]|uniref:histidine kinase n=1 Tax=Helicobacter cappadocius TaxID=3063998 RepID=A0AA90PJZ8_9HELI|nr:MULTISPECIES: HAMP domain-containing sensor histidine kinase [unclassified Helicobacter]MDO7252862.1 HAMP domain-containing sensor histidine kinase [Helicobacter sp. faydin-H75]MDP2538905.1 HAMP domain-containing sensor histidine kinase [Helicobacter sp. faydin-H76]